LVSAAILAYSIRKLPSFFNESSSIALAVYTFLLLSLIILILALTLNNYPPTVDLFLMLAFFIASFSSLCLLFGPKVFVAIFQTRKQHQGSSRSIPFRDQPFQKKFLFRDINLDCVIKSVSELTVAVELLQLSFWHSFGGLKLSINCN